MKKKILISLIVLIILITIGLLKPFINKSEESNELIIFAAASLSDVFQELVEKFELQYQGTDIKLNFASSGKLQIQIEQGAPVDVFASAGVKQMDVLQSKELMIKNTIKIFAGNHQVIIRPAGETTKINAPEDLLSNEIREICIADPKTVPAGQYSAEILHNLNLWGVLEGKLVYASNVRQVLQYVERGEVDLGFVYTTDALKSDEVDLLYRIPVDLYSAIEYPIGIVMESNNRNLAQKFIDWVLSEAGQAILIRYGFRNAN